MTEILFILAYVLPLVLLAVVFSSLVTRPRWLIPTLLVALPMFYSGHYLFVQHLQGWPSTQQPPEDFELIAYRVEEPESAGSRAGIILLWLIDDARQMPRAYRLPYDRALHENLNEAGKRLAAGARQYGESAPTPEGAGGSDPATPHIRFTNRPPLALPPKTDSGN